MPEQHQDPIEELRDSLDDPRWTQELWLIANALVALAEKVEALHG